MDSNLVKKAQAGELSAMDELYNLHVHSLFSFVHYKIGNVANTEDIVSEAFFRAFSKIGTFKFKSTFKTWLFTIARNLVTDHLSRSSKKHEVSMSDDWWLQQKNINNKKDNKRQIEATIQVAKILSKLPPQQAQVLSLRFLAGLNIKETAEQMNIKSNYVKVLQHRAIKNAKQKFK